MKAQFDDILKNETVSTFYMRFSELKSNEDRIRAYAFLSYFQNMFSELAEANERPVIISFYERDNRTGMDVKVEMNAEYSSELVKHILCTFLVSIGLKCKCCNDKQY